jgi:hypothetical protein
VSSSPRTVRISPVLYPRSALLQASEAFKDVCDIAYDDLGDEIQLTITPREEVPASATDEFLTYALSAALELHLSELS